MVSKRLAFALTVGIGVCALFYILVLSPISPQGLSTGSDAVPIYKYNSIPLRFAKGDVRIQARKGYIAYVGSVEKGMVKGQGKLYSEGGDLIYEGEFDQNMFNGVGRLYYPTNELKYEGEFADNLYQGQGRQYRAAGSLEYRGEFLQGMRNGQGQLINASGVQIFSGTFQMDNILYTQLIGKSTAEIAQMYTGSQNVYFHFSEYCVEMREIGAVYSVDSDQNTLEAEWIVKNVIVLADEITVGSEKLNEINQLSAFFGAPDYFGEAWVNLTEAVAVNLLEGYPELSKVEMRRTSTFDNVFDVNYYDWDYSLYIFAYKMDGLMYTFYCTAANSQSFFMYSITTD